MKRIAIFLTPLVLLYAYDKQIALRDRLYYLWHTLSTCAPIVVLANYFYAWQQTHQAFIIALVVALSVNLVIGALYHIRNHSFSWRALLIKNAQMLGVVAAVYLLLDLLKVPLRETSTGEVFESTLQMMTLLYPVSKAIKNIFVLTHGKYPPSWVIKALYNYEREGKLKEFFVNE